MTDIKDIKERIDLFNAQRKEDNERHHKAMNSILKGLVETKKDIISDIKDMRKNSVKTYRWTIVLFASILVTAGGFLINNLTDNTIALATLKSDVNILKQRECIIKGNMESMKFHVKGKSPYWEITVAERCFKSEQEAINSGYTPYYNLK